MKSLFNKLVKRNGGFTLTELAVAMVVVGILASIAVPSFLGARNNAFDREAQAAVDAALNAASLHYANNGDFTDSATNGCNTGASTTLAADLQRLEPNFDMVSGSAASALPRRVSVQSALTYNADSDGLGCQAFYAVALSRSGTCWVGRLTIEGKFLQLTSAPLGIDASKILVNTGGGNTANSATSVITNLEVNGKAYGGLIATSPAADAAASSSTDINTIQTACQANNQATLDAATGVTANGVDPAQFYDAWRTVVVVTNGGS